MSPTLHIARHLYVIAIGDPYENVRRGRLVKCTERNVLDLWADAHCILEKVYRLSR